MTIAISLKINDGIVLAADSAGSIASTTAGGGVDISNVYFNAHKVFNLHKGLPIGALTYGLGNIGVDSISTLSKGLRRRLQGEDPDHLDWKIDPHSYQMQEVAERAMAFLYDEHYQHVHGSA